jgi:hypothetical protein
MMQEVHYMKRIYEAVGYQVRCAVRAGDLTDLARDLGRFVPPAHRISQIGSDPMSILSFSPPKTNSSVIVERFFFDRGSGPRYSLSEVLRPSSTDYLPNSC